MAYREAVAAEPERSRAHAGLVDEVKTGQAAHRRPAERTERRCAARSPRPSRRRSAAAPRSCARVREQQAAAGLAAVTGPGAVVRLADAPAPIDPATGRPSTAEVNRVLDVDLQARGERAVGRGAEAIAINGQRLTATSTIRTAGNAILVDFRPVTSPYEVSAIGPDDLERHASAGPPAAASHAPIWPTGTGWASPPAPTTDLHAAGRRPARPCATPTRSCRHPGGDRVIAVLALIAGVVAGLLLEPTVPVALQPYLPIAVVAALDAVFGGVRAKLDGVFDDKQFVISFISNVLVAAFIVYLGDQLGVGGQLSTGVVVVLGVRIFGNVAAIRRHLFRA